MYIQGESIAVHVGDRDIVFNKHDKMYVADFSEWIRGDDGTSDCYDA